MQNAECGMRNETAGRRDGENQRHQRQAVFAVFGVGHGALLWEDGFEVVPDDEVAWRAMWPRWRRRDRPDGWRSLADQGVAHFAQRPFQSAVVFKGHKDGALEAMVRVNQRAAWAAKSSALPAVTV